MRTLVIQSSPDAAPPKDLSDIIANGSTVVLVTLWFRLLAAL